MSLGTWQEHRRWLHLPAVALAWLAAARRQCRRGGCSATIALENRVVTKAALRQFWRLLGPKGTCLLNHAFHIQGIDPLYVWFCYDSVNCR